MRKSDAIFRHAERLEARVKELEHDSAEWSTIANWKEELLETMVEAAGHFHNIHHASYRRPPGGPYPPCDCELAKVLQAAEGKP